MLLLGIDLGTSSIKASVIDAETQKWIASAQYPEQETPIKSLQTGWAEQSPEDWWQNIKQAIKKLISTRQFDPREISFLMACLIFCHQKLISTRQFDPREISAIGIAYQ